MNRTLLWLNLIMIIILMFRFGKMAIDADNNPKKFKMRNIEINSIQEGIKVLLVADKKISKRKPVVKFLKLLGKYVIAYIVLNLIFLIGYIISIRNLLSYDYFSSFVFTFVVVVFQIIPLLRFFGRYSLANRIENGVVFYMNYFSINVLAYFVQLLLYVSMIVIGTFFSKYLVEYRGIDIIVSNFISQLFPLCIFQYVICNYAKYKISVRKISKYYSPQIMTYILLILHYLQIKYMQLVGFDTNISKVAIEVLVIFTMIDTVVGKIKNNFN